MADSLASLGARSAAVTSTEKLSGGRIRLPIIVHGDQVSVSIPKFKDRIQQGIGDTEIRQRGTERTHHYRGLNPTLRAYNETTNHDIGSPSRQSHVC